MARELTVTGQPRVRKTTYDTPLYFTGYLPGTRQKVFNHLVFLCLQNTVGGSITYKPKAIVGIHASRMQAAVREALHGVLTTTPLPTSVRREDETTSTRNAPRDIMLVQKYGSRSVFVALPTASFTSDYDHVVSLRTVVVNCANMTSLDEVLMQAECFERTQRTVDDDCRVDILFNNASHLVPQASPAVVNEYADVTAYDGLLQVGTRQYVVPDDSTTLSSYLRNRVTAQIDSDPRSVWIRAVLNRHLKERAALQKRLDGLTREVVELRAKMAKVNFVIRSVESSTLDMASLVDLQGVPGVASYAVLPYGVTFKTDPIYIQGYYIGVMEVVIDVVNFTVKACNVDQPQKYGEWVHPRHIYSGGRSCCFGGYADQFGDALTQDLNVALLASVLVNFLTDEDLDSVVQGRFKERFACHKVKKPPLSTQKSKWITLYESTLDHDDNEEEPIDYAAYLGEALWAVAKSAPDDAAERLVYEEDLVQRFQQALERKTKIQSRRTTPPLDRPE